MTRKAAFIISLTCVLFNLQGQNVGVGTTSPQAQLHIQIGSSYYQPAFIVDKKGAPLPYMIITPDGKVGIGLVNPSQILDVSGNIQFSGALMPAGNAGTTGQVLVSQGPGTPPQWTNTSSLGDDWGNQVAQTQNPIVGDGTSTNPITIQSGTSSGDILIWDGSQWVIQQPGASSGVTPLCSSPSLNFLQKWTGTELCNSIIYDNGTNVGIGTTAPSQKLDVAGNIQFSGALMPGGNAGTTGQVLVSQGPGSAPQWQNASAIGDNWGSQVAVTQNPVVGDGTSSNPITFASGSAVGDVWQWDGTTWQLVQLKSAVSSVGFDSVCSGVLNNYVQKWTGSELCNSIIYDNGTNVGIGTTTPFKKLDVAGEIAGRTGYGDTIILGGDAGGSDAEIRLYAPSARNQVALWNSRLGKRASLKTDSIHANGVIRVAGSGGTGNSYILGNLGVGTASINPSAAFEVFTTKKGMLVPRLTVAQRNSISNPAHGLLILNIDSFCYETYDSSTNQWQVISCPRYMTYGGGGTGGGTGTGPGNGGTNPTFTGKGRCLTYLVGSLNSNSLRGFDLVIGASSGDTIAFLEAQNKYLCLQNLKYFSSALGTTGNYYYNNLSVRVFVGSDLFVLDPIRNDSSFILYKISNPCLNPTVIWSKRFYISNAPLSTSRIDYHNIGIVAIRDTIYIIARSRFATDTSYYVFIVKIDTSGNLVWAKQIKMPSVSGYNPTASISAGIMRSVSREDLLINSMVSSYPYGDIILRLNTWSGSVKYAKQGYYRNIIHYCTYYYCLFGAGSSISVTDTNFNFLVSRNFSSNFKSFFYYDTLGNFLVIYHPRTGPDTPKYRLAKLNFDKSLNDINVIWDVALKSISSYKSGYINPLRVIKGSGSSYFVYSTDEGFSDIYRTAIDKQGGNVLSCASACGGCISELSTRSLGSRSVPSSSALSLTTQSLSVTVSNISPPTIQYLGQVSVINNCK
ncbi:MAG: hypothetical protein GXO48_09715 [Chlorobi bacterium]|nr:hypothetical protein [Chlorobiota bacterium]